MHLDEHSGLFAGHIAALAAAADDRIVSNHELVERVDECYEETRETDL